MARITTDDLKQTPLPAQLTVVSKSAPVHAGLQSGSPVLQRLALGDQVVPLRYADGPLRRRNCQATPFDGCISQTNVWVGIRTSGGKEGFCSLLDFRFPPGSGTQPQAFDALFGLEKTGSPIRLRGSPVEGWELPKAVRSSYLDRFGWHNAMPKLLTPSGELIVSRREIEYLVRQSYPTTHSRFSYQGTGRRVPPHAKPFPPLIQPLVLDPGLSALVIYENGAQSKRITALDAVHYFTFYPKFQEDGIPLRYRLPFPLKGALALVLLTDTAARQIQQEEVIVSTTTSRRRVYDGIVAVTTTTVDLNGDGQPEIARFASDFREPGCNAATDECGSPWFVIVMLHEGTWFKTAVSQRGQDGMEGF